MHLSWSLEQFLGPLNNIFCSTDLNLNFINMYFIRSLELFLGRLNKIFCSTDLNLKFLSAHIIIKSLEQFLGRLKKLVCSTNLNLKFITMHYIQTPSLYIVQILGWLNFFFFFEQDKLWGLALWLGQGLNPSKGFPDPPTPWLTNLYDFFQLQIIICCETIFKVRLA